MEKVGEELYSIIAQIYPELAPKLTGMLLQLGQAECEACLECQEKLAERLDEAFRILDEAGGGARPAKATAPQPLEKRVDPEDGQARTFEELKKLCAGQYTAQEIDEYWRTMKPAGGPTTAPKAASAPAAASAHPAAATASAPAGKPAAKPSVASAEQDGGVPGLAAFLRQLKLTGYTSQAASWAEEQGACNIEEIVENLEDFADELAMKPLERKRLANGAADAAQAVRRELEATKVAATAAPKEVAPPPEAEEAPEPAVTSPPPAPKSPEEEFPALGPSAGPRKKR